MSIFASKLNEIMSCMLPQNGVLEGPMHYSGSGDTTPQLPVGSSADSGDMPKRPKKLPVVSPKGFAVKSLRGEDSEDIEDGSLPCTPEQHSDIEMDVSSCPAGDEVLDSDTKELIYRFLRDYTGLSKPQWNESKALSTMKRVVDGVLEKHRFAFNGMINKLSLDDRADDATFVSSVATNLFGDGTTNWGRIASLVAFGAVVSQYLKERGRENCVELVGCEISTYLLKDQRDWLVKNNSWEGFVEFFRVSDPESTVRNTLMAVAGVAGLGATLALLIRDLDKTLSHLVLRNLDRLHGGLQ